MNEDLHASYTCKNRISTRVRQPHWKKTVSITLPQELVKEAKIRQLNISRICEQALNSIFDYLEAPNTQRRSKVLNSCSFQENGMDGPGFEPGTSTMPTWRSYQADLPAQDLASES